MEAAEKFLGHELDIGFLQSVHDKVDDGIGDPFHSPSSEDAESAVLPLPSYIGVDNCRQKGLQHLVDQELQLRQGQANDALHEIRLALADKSAIFRQDVRHAGNYNMATRAWKKVADMEMVIKRYAKVYRRCRQQMVSLDADDGILDRYKPLDKDHLKISTAVADPNARGHRHENMAWFWTMDIPKDTNENDWMSECKCQVGIM